MLSCGVKVTRRGRILEGGGKNKNLSPGGKQPSPMRATDGAGCSVLPGRFAFSHRIPVSLFTWQERKPGLAVALCLV